MVQASFQTPTYCFEVNFNETPLAKAILESLPIDSTISLSKEKISFKTKVKPAVAQATDTVEIG